MGYNYFVNSPAPLVDIIIPVYNEEAVLAAFHQQLCQSIDILPYEFSICYVDDGSSDHSCDVLAEMRSRDGRVNVVELSRNFGHQAALTAGLDRARGKFTITMDGDGQHPPSMIPEMLRFAEDGYDLVLTQRLDAKDLTAFKRGTSAFFYGLINRMGETNILPGGADFRLLSQTAVQGLRQMPEYHRFLRGMVAWIGFRSVILPFTPPARLGGQSKYSLRKMLRLGLDAIFSFSLVPLYVSVSVGVLFLIGALAEVIYVLSFWISGNTSKLAPGWSSLMFVLLFVGGTLMISLGFTGIYVGYIFQEVKHRPVYIVRREDIPISKSESLGKRKSEQGDD